METKPVKQKPEVLVALIIQESLRRFCEYLVIKSFLYSVISSVQVLWGDAVALLAGHWTCNLQVAGSSLESWLGIIT